MNTEKSELGSMNRRNSFLALYFNQISIKPRKIILGLIDYKNKYFQEGYTTK